MLRLDRPRERARLGCRLRFSRREQLITAVRGWVLAKDDERRGGLSNDDRARLRPWRAPTGHVAVPRRGGRTPLPAPGRRRESDRLADRDRSRRGLVARRRFPHPDGQTNLARSCDPRVSWDGARELGVLPTLGPRGAPRSAAPAPLFSDF